MRRGRFSWGRSALCDAGEAAYLEARFVPERDGVAGHLVLGRLRDGLPGDGGDGLRFLGKSRLVFRES